MDYTKTLSELAQSLLALALPIIAAYVAHAVKSFYDAKLADLKASAGENSWLVDQAINTAVHAAEQLLEGSKPKLDYAIETATDLLAKRGVTLDLKTLRALIEAEVNREFPHK